MLAAENDFPVVFSLIVMVFFNQKGSGDVLVTFIFLNMLKLYFIIATYLMFITDPSIL